ncbi:MAG TPA: acyl carrier protein [Rhodopila sp.]
MTSTEDRVRQLLLQQGTVIANVETLLPDADLYAAGLNSLTSVDLMLAIEQAFDFVFPDDALNRRTFSSIGSIAATIERLTADVGT